MRLRSDDGGGAAREWAAFPFGSSHHEKQPPDRRLCASPGAANPPYVAGHGALCASGPFGTKCFQCAHYGYWRQIKNAAGDTVDTRFRKGACGRYSQITGQHGPVVPAGTESCRYFTPRDP